MEQPFKKNKFSYLALADLVFSFVHKRSGTRLTLCRSRTAAWLKVKNELHAEHETLVAHGRAVKKETTSRLRTAPSPWPRLSNVLSVLDLNDPAQPF